MTTLHNRFELDKDFTFMWTIFCVKLHVKGMQTKLPFLKQKIVGMYISINIIHDVLHIGKIYLKILIFKNLL